MRVVLLFALLACKDQAKTEVPRVGSASAVAPSDARSTPPVKTTRPIDAAKAQQLAKLDVDGYTREVRNADDKGVDVRYLAKARPTIQVSVNASRCFDCPAMEPSAWRAKSDALRYVIGPELKDHRDTTWETGMTDLAGAPVAWTYHVAFASPGSAGARSTPRGSAESIDGAAYATAYAVYYNDGVNMIRIVAEYKDDAPKSRDAMVAATPKQSLEQTAKAFLDAFTHAW